MEIVKIDNAQEFDEFLRSHPKGHMQQSSAWGKVKKEWEWTGFISRNENGEIKGVCSVLLRQIPMTPFRMMYSPRGPVCDPNDEASLRELKAGIDVLAKKYKAHAFILCHNHPSGWAFFSEDDVNATRDLLQLCGHMKLAMIDHLLVADSTVMSMRSRAYIPETSWADVGPDTIPLGKWRKQPL